MRAPGTSLTLSAVTRRRREVLTTRTLKQSPHRSGALHSTDRRRRRCGCESVPRNRVTPESAHEPLGLRLTRLLLTLRRFRCSGCGQVWRQDLSKAAEPRATSTRGGLGWALSAIDCQQLTVLASPKAAGSPDTADDAVLDEGRRLLISDPAHLDGVAVIGSTH